MSAIVQVNDSGATVVVTGAGIVTEAQAAASSATTSANAAALSASVANTARVAAEAARDGAVASVAAGNIYLTKAAADAALSGVAANAWVRVQADETQGNAPWFYQKVSGVYVSRGPVIVPGPVTTPTPALSGGDIGIVAHDVLPTTSPLINSAGGNDAIRVRVASLVSLMTNGPVGHVNYYNTVCGFGSNINTNWTQINPGLPGASMRIESKFFQEDCFGTEFHWSILTTGGQEFRALSSFVPHNASDWPTKGGISIHGSYISLFDGRNQNRHFIDGRNDTWSIPKPAFGNAMRFNFAQNNRSPMQQINQAGNAFLNLPFLNNRNELQVEQPTYLQAPGVINLFGLRGASCVLYLDPLAEDTAFYRTGNALVTGNYTFERDDTQATGTVLWLRQNTRAGGGVSNTISHHNGTASWGIENFGTGEGNFQIRYIHSSNETVFDNGYRNGAGSAEAFRIARTTGRVTFAYPPRLPSYTLANLPSASAVGAGSQAFCTNESGGAVPVFSDGTNWRRVTDRAIAS